MIGHGATTHSELLLVRSALENPHSTVRRRALGALARAGHCDAATLRTALTDPDANVRRRALELVAAHPDRTLVAPVVTCLDDADTLVVDAAAFALGEMGQGLDGRRLRASTWQQALDRLEAVATDHDDALCREAAIAALGAIGSPRSRDTVIAATDDRPGVRRRATVALAAFEGPEVEAALRRAGEDRDWQVRDIAHDLLEGS